MAKNGVILFVIFTPTGDTFGIFIDIVMRLHALATFITHSLFHIKRKNRSKVDWIRYYKYCYINKAQQIATLLRFMPGFLFEFNALSFK